MQPIEDTLREQVFQLWGKTAANDRFHPAIYHMLDVGHVARALLSDAASPRFRHALRYAWRGANVDALIDWLPFLVALHDLGKIAAAFQGQQTTASAARQRERLERAGFTFSPRAYTDPPPHNAISAIFLRQWFAELEPGLHRHIVTIVCDALGGHHGFFVQDVGVEQGKLRLTSESPKWEDLRRAGYDLLRATLAPQPGSLPDIGKPRSVRSATIALTGLIVLADWIGSSTDFFPPNCETPLDEYVQESTLQAREAVEQVGFAYKRAAPTYTTFSDLFDVPEPRPLQCRIDALDTNDLAGPALYVIEAPTGEGKTEAALALARRIAAREASDELFFALPTMATGNQMFGRLSRFYYGLYGTLGAVKLVHGQATLVEDELRRIALLDHAYDDSDTDTPHWAASGDEMLHWFGSSKRALLAPFGAGTVDQVEMAGLHTRYYMLKLFSLAGKVIVIDEVHAYDAYMNTILEHTLRWLSALGSSVILLSATLPSQRHAKLAHAFLQSVIGEDAPVPNIPAKLLYPVLSIYSVQQQRSLSVAAFRAEQRLTLRLIHDDSYAAQARRLLDLVAEGGAVARLCNRVDDAQHIFRELQRLDPPECVLIHARFPLDERQKREQRVNDLVGRDAKRLPTDRVIIVGTQVLEQSLDYDVDVMVTDLAPIDLLLQRAGRLHRHDRQRLPQFSDAVMYVQLPLAAQEMPDWERWKRIYDEYILWRTWEILKKCAADSIISIMLPRDYRPLIEEVYTTELPPLDADAPYAEAMRKAWSAMQAGQAMMKDEAKLRLTPDPLSRDGIACGDALEFIEDEEGALIGWQAAKTRLGERITVIPVYDIDGMLSIDAQGRRRVSGKPDTATQIALLNHALPISDPRLIAALSKTRWPWRKPPALLKHVCPLKLDASDTTTIAGIPVRLDPLLGLTINQEIV
ncbi:MAG TPA: CRISPR-associated helicase Cas3' [Herpetosiphonaceae bacterium]